MRESSRRVALDESKMEPQIVAIGGGGFSSGPENLLLENYVLGLVHKPRPKVCFLPTASGDSEQYLLKFYASFARLAATANHLSLFRLAVSDFRSYLLRQDIVYVGGGNTRNMLVLWREFGLDVILREAWEKGTILCGTSAGSICWFEQGLSDSLAAGELRPMACLGFLRGSSCPHYDGEPLRRPCFQRLVSEGSMIDGYAVDDWVGLHFVGSKLHQVVSAKPNANAYEVSRDGVGFHEKVIQPILLESSSGMRSEPGEPPTSSTSAFLDDGDPTMP
jgi:peptidase E